MKASATAKFKTVNEYQSSLSENRKVVFRDLRKILNDAAPGAEETISYNIPCLKFHGGLIWFAMWKSHYSLYPKSAKMEAAIKELSRFEGAKGTIKFPIDQPLPEKLITRIIKFRIKENLEHEKEKAGK